MPAGIKKTAIASKKAGTPQSTATKASKPGTATGTPAPSRPARNAVGERQSVAAKGTIVKAKAAAGPSATRRAGTQASPASKAAKKGAAALATHEPKRSIEDDLPVCSFRTQQEFEAWMHRHHQTLKGLWLRLYKKGAGTASISRAEAIDVVLCFGWIDGVANRYDAQSFLIRFTPRRSKSIWSKVNIGHVTRLIEAGRMQENGLKEVAAAKADGRWAQAYDPPSTSTIPDDFLKLLKKNKAAHAFFQTLNKTNLFAISWRLQTAKKPETKARRTEMIIAMLAEGKKFH